MNYERRHSVIVYVTKLYSMLFKFKFKFNFISSQFKVTNIQRDIKSVNLQTKIDTAICKV